MNIKETKSFLKACDLTDRSPLISGVHGLGKSDIVKQYAKEHDMHCETLILSLMDVSDLMGMPRSAEVGGTLTTLWSAPDWFNRITNAAFPVEVNFEDVEFNDKTLKEYMTKHLDISKPVGRADLNKLYSDYHRLPNDMLRITTVDDISYKHARRSVLFVDEFNRAPIDILNASLQLILDKRLHSHVLPRVNGKPTLIAAAINPADQDYTVNTFDPALLDRFVFGTVEPDAKAWLDWARDTEQATVVRDFIGEHPDRIHYTAKDGSSSATPRSWAALSAVMKQVENIDEEVRFQMFKGCIGQELASQFLAYWNNYFKVVKIDDIEKLVANKSKRIKDIEKLGEQVNKLIASQEAIQKSELAETLYKKYVNEADPEKAKPLLAYLYGLELEVLNSFLKSKKEESFEEYMKLSTLDMTINQKGLFKRITTKVKDN